MKKKTVYKLLISASLLATATNLAVATVPTVYADGGSFTVGNNDLNIRRSPSLNGEVVGQYPSGTIINYDSVVEGDGYRWISYVGASGNRNYVAIEKLDGSQSFGQFITSSGSSPSMDDSDKEQLSVLLGRWENGQNAAVTITADGQFFFEPPFVSNTLTGFTNSPTSTGEISFNIRYGNSGTGGVYVPAGVKFSSGVAQVDDSDLSRERLLFAQGTVGSTKDSAFYRVTESKIEEKKVTSQIVKGSPWTGENPYPTSLITDFVQPTRDGSNPKAEKYALYDIDGNGTPELILGSQDEIIWQVLTLVKGEPEIIGYSDGQSIVVATTDGRVISKGSSATGLDFLAVSLREDNSGVDKETISWNGQGASPLAAVTAISDIEWQLVSNLGKADGTSDKETDKETESSSSSSKDTESSNSSLTDTPSDSSGSKKEITGNAIQKFYQKMTGRKSLPSTGEAVSVIGGIGATILGAVVYLFYRRRNK